MTTCDFEIWGDDAPAIVLGTNTEFEIWDQGAPFNDLGEEEAPETTVRRRAFFIE